MNRSLTLLVALLSALAAQAQLPELGIDPTATPFADTVIYETIGDIEGEVINVSNQVTYTGWYVAHLGMMVQGQLMEIDTVHGFAALVPAQTNDVTFHQNFGFLGNYQLGVNQMRMWVTADSAISADTLAFTIFCVPDPIDLIQLLPDTNGYPDSVALGSSLPIFFYIQNNSFLELSSDLSFHIGVRNDNGNFMEFNSFEVPNYTLVPSAVETQTFGNVDISIANGFEDGGNIVLIWPEAPDVTTTPDSLEIPIEVVDWPANIGPNPTKSKLRLFPNPTNGMITVYSGTDRLPESITVVDVSGRIVERVSNVATLSLQDYPAGIYAITVVLGEEERTFRVMRN